MYVQLVADIFDCLIFEGSAIVHIRSTSYVQLFAEYADNIFMGFYEKRITRASDWDRPGSLKYSTR